MSPNRFIINYDDDIHLGTIRIRTEHPSRLHGLMPSSLPSTAYVSNYRQCYLLDPGRTMSPQHFRTRRLLLCQERSLRGSSLFTLTARPPNVEFDWPLVLEPITYSSSRRQVLSVSAHVDSDYDWAQHPLIRYFRISCCPDLEHSIIDIHHSDVSSYNC
ncbi:uncharacterized protein ARMOST_16864 [Armillaria ostoyae]|uniref:Uncharacterized protein n=1 Tax=Armillaria ostoyae TaxID=47428 RepID=A0A284RXD3_ARMOS|nr:uncharacterized protein ARMOST_16864 [Armillaria ostoyae]